MAKYALKLSGIILLLLAIFLGQSFISHKNKLSRAFSALFDAPIAVVHDALYRQGLGDQVRTLELENHALRAQLAARVFEPRFSGEHGRSAIVAKVFSSYPFNNQQLITVNAGNRSGIVPGLPVTVGGAILVGRIIEVGSDISIVRTIFDNAWELPVKIGDGAVDALFVGGRREPQLTLIPKGKIVQAGETVIAAHADFPYGLVLGKVQNIESSLASVLGEATVAVPYDLADLDEVDILLP